MSADLTFPPQAQGLLAEEQAECLRSLSVRSARRASQRYLPRDVDKNTCRGLFKSGLRRFKSGILTLGRIFELTPA